MRYRLSQQLKEDRKITTTTIYRNRYNHNKYIEIHNDGHYHNSVRQYMSFQNGVKNLTGDRCLHRQRKGNLISILEDYERV